MSVRFPLQAKDKPAVEANRHVSSISSMMTPAVTTDQENVDSDDLLLDIAIANHYERRYMNMFAFAFLLFICCLYVFMMQYSLVCCSSTSHMNRVGWQQRHEGKLNLFLSEEDVGMQYDSQGKNMSENQSSSSSALMPWLGILINASVYDSNYSNDTVRGLDESSNTTASSPSATEKEMVEGPNHEFLLNNETSG